MNVNKSNNFLKKTNQLQSKIEKLLANKTKNLNSAFEKQFNKFLNETKETLTVLEENCIEFQTVKNELELSRNRYYNLYDFAPIGYVSFCSKGKVLEINQHGADLLGIDKRSIIGQTFNPFISSKDKKHFTLHRQKVEDSKTKQFCELKLVKKDGSIFDVYLESIPVFGDMKEFFQIRTSITDLTQIKNQEKKLQETKLLADLIIEQSPVPIEIFDLNGFQIRVNQAFENFFDVIANQAIDQYNILSDPTAIIQGYTSAFEKARKGKNTILSNVELEPIISETQSNARWVNSRIFPLKDTNGKVINVIITHEDRTETILAERALRESHNLFAESRRVAQIGYWEWDMINDEITWSDELYTFYKRPKELGPLHHEWIDYVIPEDRQRIKKLMKQAAAGEKGFGADYGIICEDGEIKYFHSESEIFVDDSGQPARMIGTVLDITQRQRSEDELKYWLDFEQLISAISAELINIPVNKIDRSITQALKEIAKFASVSRCSLFLFSPDLEEVYNSHEWCAKRKDSQIELLKDVPIEVFGFYLEQFKRDENVAFSSLEDIPSYLKPEILWLKKKEFRPFLFVPLTTEENLIGALGVFDDVGEVREWDEKLISLLRFVGDIFANAIERRRNEEAIKESENRLRTLQNNVPVGIFRSTPKGKLISVNTTVLKAAGYKSEKEMLAVSSREFYVDPDARKKMIDILNKKGIAKDIELYVKRKDGTSRWISANMTAIKNDKGEIQYIDGVGVDITEKKLAQKIAREQTEQLKIKVNQLNCLNKFAKLVIQFDKSEDTVLQEITNLIAKSLRYPNCSSVRIVFDNREISSNKFKKSNCNKIFKFSISGDKYGTLEVYRKNEKSLKFEESFHEEEKQLLETLAIEIGTFIERKKYEQELLNNQKLESVATLAGGIAHGFNNLLTGILGNISFAKLDLDEDDDLFDVLTEAEKAGWRARSLTQQLLTYSEGSNLVKEPAEIERLLRDSVMLALTDSKIKAEVEIAKNLQSVNIDISQISQVIHNIVENAIQAMPNGGSVKIAASNILITEKNKLPVKNGKFIKVSFTDAGKGISKKNLRKVFDPYFSTRTSHSGLGLAAAYSILVKHEGHIEVDSVIGTGSVFTIYLPAATKTKPKHIEGIKKVNKGFVLIMDDEELLRNLAIRSFTKYGYKIDVAKDGEEALKLFKKAKKNKKPYNVVVLDLVVPEGMGGEETIEQLLRIDPKVKAIVCSGFSNDLILADHEKYGFSAVISKPYKFSELDFTIQKLIDSDE